MTERQIQFVMANCPHGIGKAVKRQGCEEIAKGNASRAANEKD